MKHIIQWDVDAKYNNVLDVVSAADIETCKAAGIELLGLSAVKARGAAAKEAIQPNPAKPDDLAYIMYTSGTTGNPKGAMLLHSNIVSSIAAVPFIVTLTDKDSYLSYLPLCHIYEVRSQQQGGGSGRRWRRSLLAPSLRDCRSLFFSFSFLS